MNNENTTNDTTTNDNSGEDTEGHAMKVRPFLPDAEVADDTEGNCFKYGTDVPDTGSVRQTHNSEPATDGDDTEGHTGYCRF